MNEPRSANHDLAMLCLRIGLGILFIWYGWAKVSHVAGVVGLWHRLRLPLPAVFGPIHAIVEFAGGFFLLGGLLTRLVGLLLAVDMLGALLLVKIHTPAPIGVEWLALWGNLALLAGGAGAFSLDAIRRRRRVGVPSH